MPTKTFFNLAEHKRKRIFQEALAEFAQDPYEQASLSEIVQRLGIAKGSMYQYFQDKKDLYKYVIGYVYQQKREYLQPVWEQDTDFFALVKSYYMRSWQFAREHPCYQQVISNFWDSRDEQVREEILREKQIRNTEFYGILQQWLQTGLISSEITPEAAWFVYHAVGRALIDNFVDENVDLQSHESLIESVLAVLELGLRTRKECR